MNTSSDETPGAAASEEPSSVTGEATEPLSQTAAATPVEPPADAPAPAAPVEPSMAPVEPPAAASVEPPAAGAAPVVSDSSGRPTYPSGLPGGLRRQGWMAALAVVAALGLLAGAFAVGVLVASDDSGPDPAAQTLVAASNDEAPSEAPAAVGSAAEPADGGAAVPSPLPTEPGPLAGVEADEPVAAVARVLTPSVVVITSGEGQGSGIVWDADAGYVVTNQHVVNGSETVEVTFSDGTRTEAEVLGGSPYHDVAVVRVDPDSTDMVPAAFAGQSTVEVGQLAVAVGAPFGMPESVTAGVVSAIRVVAAGGIPGPFEPPEGFGDGFGFDFDFGDLPDRSDFPEPIPVRMIQTDAPINTGSSGGALADRQGRVIGMNTMIQTGGLSTANVGVGFALPSDTVLLIAQRVVDGESLELGFLGITSSDDGSGEIRIGSVAEGSPADEAGLLADDVIAALDGEPMDGIIELSAAIKLRQPGERVELTVDRNGETRTVTVELGTYE